MKKNLILITICIVYNAHVNGQVLYVAPNGKTRYRAKEGSWEKAKIDQVTSLPDLIKRLEKTWQLVEIGKGYWIGYTDDMYSIAAHKDSAINLLLNLINSTKKNETKLGAILTIHLIGINSTVTGRYTENFVNKNARKALLGLIDLDDLTGEVMSLLVRDPWQSDIPMLFTKLQNKKKNYWTIINGLSRYQVPGLPLMQPLPDKFRNVFISIDTDTPTESEEDAVEAVLHKIDKYKSPFVIVDPTLLDTKIVGNVGVT